MQINCEKERGSKKSKKEKAAENLCVFKSNDHEMSEMWQEQAKQSKEAHKGETEEQTPGPTAAEGAEEGRKNTLQARGTTEVCIANKEAASMNLSKVSKTRKQVRQ